MSGTTGRESGFSYLGGIDSLSESLAPLGHAMTDESIPADCGAAIVAYESHPDFSTSWYQRLSTNQRKMVEDQGHFGTIEQFQFRHGVMLDLMKKQAWPATSTENIVAKMALIPHSAVGARDTIRPVSLLMMQPVDFKGRDKRLSPSVTKLDNYKNVVTRQYVRMLHAAYRYACDPDVNRKTFLRFGLLGLDDRCGMSLSDARTQSLLALAAAIRKMPVRFYDRVRLQCVVVKDTNLFATTLRAPMGARTPQGAATVPEGDVNVFRPELETFCDALSRAYEGRRNAWYAVWRRASMHHMGRAHALTLPDVEEDRESSYNGQLLEGALRWNDVNPTGHFQVIKDAACHYGATDSDVPADWLALAPTHTRRQVQVAAPDGAGAFAAEGDSDGSDQSGEYDEVPPVHTPLIPLVPFTPGATPFNHAHDRRQLDAPGVPAIQGK